MSLTTSEHEHAEAFTSAMQRGDVDAADRALSSLGKSVPAELLESAADVHMHFARWFEASKLLGRIIDVSPEQHLKLRLARNMTELAEHRPELARRLEQADNDGAFQIAQGAGDQLTILHQPSGSQATMLSPGGDPATSTRQSMRQLEPAFENHQAVGVYGLGDGYLVKALAERRADDPLTPRTCVHVIVAEPQHLTAALAIHDYTGEAGPIRQPRFQWWVGLDWADQLEAALRGDLQLPFPQLCIEHAAQGRRIADRMRAVGQSVSTIALQVQPRVDAYYEQLDASELAAVFGDDPPRQPRALILTSRFTTVLQYSARDSAEALESLGWNVRLVMERSHYHQITGTSIQRHLDEHRPDMVFVIDHLRREYPKVFPKQLPWVCWIQDHLPNLTNRTAGASITRRDFVLTPVAPMYAERYDYPVRQILPVGKLTKMPTRPADWTSDGDDLAFVSHASQTPRRIIEQVVEMTGGDVSCEQIIRRCAQRMIDVYDAGRSIATPYEVRRLLDETEAETGIAINIPDLRPMVVDWLFTKLNNALYRHEALGWFADIAEQRGLSLALYGHGWESHPRFGKYARGVVQYGEDLEQLARRTKINLQIVPFFCLHQRLLDGLAAGGFYLVRAHPFDMIAQRLIDFLDTHFGQQLFESTDAARRAIDAAHRDELDQLFEASAPLAERGDPVVIVQNWRRAGWLVAQQPVLPQFDEVSFHDAASARQCVERFIDDPPARRTIADAQRQNIAGRLTYEAGLRRVTRQIGQRIHAEQGATDEIH